MFTCTQRIFFKKNSVTVMKKVSRSKNAAQLPLCEFSHFPTCDNCLNIRIRQANAVYAQGFHFSRLLAAEVCASAVVMLDTPCSEVVWRVLTTHCIRQFPLHFLSSASPCAVTFQLESTTGTRGQLKCDGTRAETIFRLSVKRTCPFKSVGGVSSVDYWQPRCAHQR